MYGDEVEKYWLSRQALKPDLDIIASNPHLIIYHLAIITLLTNLQARPFDDDTDHYQTPDAREEYDSADEDDYVDEDEYMDMDEEYDWSEDSEEVEDDAEMGEYEETPEDVQLAEAMEEKMSLDN